LVPDLLPWWQCPSAFASALPALAEIQR